jgi:20S proteasome alpha/beta subunit
MIHPELIRRKPLKHDRLDPFERGRRLSRETQRKGARRMTVCVAAISSDGPCIVCVADKALSYGDAIQWDSDCTKILNLQNRAVAMISSGNEAHAERLARWLTKVEDYGGERYTLLKDVETQFRRAYSEMQAAEILTPHMLSGDDYVKMISGKKINEFAIGLARKVGAFELDCDAIICGYDDNTFPYLLFATSPGIVTDYTNIGFHANGSGAEKAISQLLFAEHKRSNGVARTLYECFDAKAHAEMAVGVGFEWDACLLTGAGPRMIIPAAKPLIDRVWAKANRSPFKVKREKDDLSNPPKDWEMRLRIMVHSSLYEKRFDDALAEVGEAIAGSV